MNFDTERRAPCVIPEPPEPDPRCASAEFALANPSICPTEPALIIRPSTAMLCALDSVQFLVFEYQNGVEVQVTEGVTFTSTAAAVFTVGVNGGAGTALSAGSAIITATKDGRTANASITVLPGTNCCDEIAVLSAIVLDRSRSMTLGFGVDYATRLNFAKAAAIDFASRILAVAGDPKDAIKVWSLDKVITDETGAYSDDSAELEGIIDGITQSLEKTDLLLAVTTATDDLLDNEADRRVLFIISDGEHTLNTNRQAIIDAATTFKNAGGIVMALGVRASGLGYDLLERVVTPGFFINALADTPLEALGGLNYFRSLLCIGDCIPTGDNYVNSPALDYSSFLNWEVTDGQVHLLGFGLLDMQPGNGLYLDMAGGSPATIRTIDTFDLAADSTYRVAFKAAGNQRQAIAGQRLKVYVREVGINDSDPNVFEQIVAPAYDQEFQTFAFNFTPLASATVRVYFEQLYNGTAPTIGNLLDNVKFENVSDATILLDDNFDGENIVYVNPRCGPSAAVVGIDDPPAPTVEMIGNFGEAGYLAVKYTYGYSWITNQGETAVTPYVYLPGDVENSANQRLVSFEPAPAEAIGIRVWRSLGEVVNRVTVSGAGTAAANGVYRKVSATRYNQDSGTHYIEDQGNFWTLFDASVNDLYNNTTIDAPVGAWIASNGDLPEPTSAISADPDATEAEMFLLAELPITEVSYVDSENTATFEARYDNTVTAPTSNTTGIAEGALGFGYSYCCGYDYDEAPGECADCQEVGEQRPDPEGLPDIETGFNPPPVFTSTKTVCETCDEGFVNNTDESLVPDMTSATAPSGTVIFDFDTGTGEASGREAWKVFDRDPATYMDLVGTIGGYVGYVFPSAVVVQRYSITARADFALGTPSAWTFEGSNNGTSWTALDTRPSEVFAAGQTKQYVTSNATAYTHYRLKWTSNQSGNVTNNSYIAEFGMFAPTTAESCATATRTSQTSQSHADQLATAAARTEAEAGLNCVQVWTATESYTAPCQFGTFGASVSKSATRTSLVSMEDAQAQALAAAQAEAEAELDCDNSNNEQQITINDSDGGISKAAPYPSVAWVEGMTGNVTKVTVTLKGFSHESPYDVRIALRSPSGTIVRLMSECGGKSGGPSGIDIEFDDDAADFMPHDGFAGPSTLAAGSYKPTAYIDPSTDPENNMASMPDLPSQPPFYGETLAEFIGEDPNGAWSLWVGDALSTFEGSIAGGWEISITSA